MVTIDCVELACMSGGGVKTKMNPHLPGSYSFEFYMRRNSEFINTFLGFFVLTYLWYFPKTLY